MLGQKRVPLPSHLCFLHLTEEVMKVICSSVTFVSLIHCLFLRVEALAVADPGSCTRIFCSLLPDPASGPHGVCRCLPCADSLPLTYGA